MNSNSDDNSGDDSYATEHANDPGNSYSGSYGLGDGSTLEWDSRVGDYVSWADLEKEDKAIMENMYGYMDTFNYYTDIHIANIGFQQMSAYVQWCDEQERNMNYQFPLQTDPLFEVYAKESGIVGLFNPGTYACCFVASIKEVATKKGIAPTVADFMEIAKLAFGAPSPYFKDENNNPRNVLGNNWFVGDAYTLMNITMNYFGFDTKALDADRTTATFSLIKNDIDIGNYHGNHFLSGDWHGTAFFNPDPNFYGSYNTTYFFQWSK